MTAVNERAAEREASGHGYGWVIIAGSVLALAGMARHPTGGGSGLLDMIRQMALQGAFNSAIHGFLIGVYLLLLLGFYGFSRRLDRDPLLAQAGFIAYTAGVFAGICAAISAGFVMRTIAISYVDAVPGQADMITGLLRVAGAFNFAWGQMWIIAMSVAILLWSLALLRKNGAVGMVGGLGVVAGGIPAIGIIFGLLPLSVFATIGIVAAHTLWSVTLGVLLVRQKL